MINKRYKLQSVITYLLKVGTSTALSVHSCCWQRQSCQLLLPTATCKRKANYTRSKYSIVLLIALSLSFIVCLSACKKKDSQVNFTGKVINPGNNQPVADAIVTLASTSVQTWVYNSNFQDIASVNSGQDGSFAFNFKEQAASAYRIYIYKNNYFANTTVINATEVSSVTGYNSTFELSPEATMALNVKNTMPHDTADRILFKIVRGAVSALNGCPDNYLVGKGTSYDTTITCKTYGNRYFVVESNITKGSNTVLRRDSIYLNPFVTTGLDVDY